MLATAEFLERNPSLFIETGLSCTSDGKPSGVFNLTTATRSGDGWLLAIAYDYFRKEELAHELLNMVNELTYKNMKESIVNISDDRGLKALVATLRKVAPKI